jgi:hypothetical protein
VIKTSDWPMAGAANNDQFGAKSQGALLALV